jgi:hypothetical protein
MRCPLATIRVAYRDQQGRSNMVTREKSIWFGCVLVASLFVLVLNGCADVSESSQRA